MLKAKPASAFDALNPSQLRAVTHGTAAADGGVAAGPLVLMAGAGTGKTQVLAHRTAHLVVNGVDPARILILAFTQRAATELTRQAQEVYSQLLAERGKLNDRSMQSRLQWSGSFHAVSNRILRLYAGQLGLDPGFTLLSRAEAANVMGVVHHELGFAAKDKRFPGKDTCLWIYGHRIHSRLSLKQTLAEQFPRGAEWEADLARLYREYVARKQKYNVLDCDDLLLYWHAMMQNATLARSLSGNFDHVLVDDYQDVSTLQGEIVQALKPDGQGVVVAADDAQAIFPMRTRTYELIPRLANRYTPKAEAVVLSQNYRATQQLLDCANALLSDGARQYRKTLFGTRQSSQKPLYITMDDDASQVEYITGKILAAREISGSLRRHAVLFRSARQSEALERELTRRAIPYVRLGSPQFLDAEHIKDLLSVLRWVDNPRNSIAGFRVLKLVPGFDPANAKPALEHFAAQGIGGKSLAAFEARGVAAKDWKLFSALLEALADPARPWAGQVKLVRDWYKPQLERLYDAAFSRVRDIEHLEHLSAQQASRERFLTELTLEPLNLTSDHSGSAASDEEYVTLATIQASIGQSWDIVYLLNTCEGNFPTAAASGKPDLIEEERRSLYVAVTRARSELHLCAPAGYAAGGRAASGEPNAGSGRSVFMTDKVLDCCERMTYRSARGADHLRAGDAATVDVASQLKEMW
jgi:DNA helicase-2/ATP-dependent DNA helicase PcrA